MLAEVKEYRDNRGLRPGMRHSGQFTSDDPRRAGEPRRLPNGRTLASLAREYTQDAVDLLGRVVKGDEAGAKIADRIAAGKILLDRGWGQAVSMVQMDVNVTQDPRSMSTAALEALVAGQIPQLPIIESEAVEVTSTVLCAVPAVSEDVS